VQKRNDALRTPWRPLTRAAIRTGCVALAVVMTAACASAPAAPPLATLRWPEPPLLTRIEFVRTVRSPADVEGPASGLEFAGEWLGFSQPKRGRAIVQPADLEVSPDGSVVYVSDFAEGIVHVLDFARRETRCLGVAEPFDRPFGLALDSTGNLWVVEQAKSRVRVVDANGRTLRQFGSDRLIRPIGIALDEQRGLVYVADGARQHSSDHYVRVFDLEGRFLRDVGRGRGSEPGFLLFPSYVALDGAGSLYVSDTMNSRIEVFAPDGSFLRSVGESGDGAGTFDKPKGLALDSFGNLYVVDSSWSNVQVFGPEGDVLIYFGGRGGYPGLLRNPTGIAISKSNEIYVGDYLNQRVSVYRLVNTAPGDGLPPNAAAPHGRGAAPQPQ
jgi:DNA-binding beta-propeller fold protein YncE